MKVLMFGWEFPPFISGGLGIACYGLSKGLADNNVHVKFVLPTKKGQQIQENIELIGGDEVAASREFIEVYKKRKDELLKYKDSIFTAAPYHTSLDSIDYFENLVKSFDFDFSRLDKSILKFSGNYGSDLMFQVTRYSIIGEVLGITEDFNIIHAHDWLSFLAGVEAKRVSGKPLVVHVHATEYDRSGENYNSDVYNIEKYGMEQADKVVAVSYYTRHIIITRYGIDPEKISVVHNAVSREKRLKRLKIHNNLKEKIVLFLGRVTMQKGPDYFIEVADRVIKKNRNVRFVMAGSGDMMPRLITRMAELRIADRFHFTGFLSREEVERMYAMSSLYIMPSVSEPFGLTAFEALLYDVPVIISKQSGVKEILKNAVTIDFWDIDKLSEEICRLLSDKQYAAAVVEKCRDDMKNIRWDAAARTLINIYNEVRSAA
jgi:glycogen synthase